MLIGKRDHTYIGAVEQFLHVRALQQLVVHSDQLNGVYRYNLSRRAGDGLAVTFGQFFQPALFQGKQAFGSDRCVCEDD